MGCTGSKIGWGCLARRKKKVKTQSEKQQASCGGTASVPAQGDIAPVQNGAEGGELQLQEKHTIQNKTLQEGKDNNLEQMRELSENYKLLKRKVAERLEELEITHNEQLRFLAEACEKAKSSFQETIDQLSSQVNFFEENMKQVEESALRRDYRKHIQDHGSPGKFWEQELESSHLAVGIKNKYIHHLEEELFHMGEVMEQNALLQRKIQRLQGENEDLRARMEYHRSDEVPTQAVKSQKQLTASEIILGKGVAVEETTTPVTGAGSVTVENELHQKGGKFSVLKNSVLRAKEPALSHFDSQSLGKGVVTKKGELPKVGKKVLGMKKNEAKSIPARAETMGSSTNTSLSQAGGLIHQAKKTAVKGEVASHRMETRKEYAAATHRNATKSQKGKVPAFQHRNESQALSSPAHKNVVHLKDRKKPTFLHRNASRTLLQKENLSHQKNASKTSPGKDHLTRHRNNSHTMRQKEHNIPTKNSTRAQRAKEIKFLHKNASLPGKDNGVHSMNTSGILPGLKQGIFQRNTSQVQTYKKPIVTHRNASQAPPEKKRGTVHRNMSWVEAKKKPIPFQKNTSWTRPQERSKPLLRNASQALPRKGHATHQRNISWTEVNKENRPLHKNASWDLLRKESSPSQKNLSQELARREYQVPQRVGGQAGAKNVFSTPSRNTTQRQALVKEQGRSRQNGFRIGAVTPRWRLTVPTGRDEPMMPSLPMTCLLSEHAIACGNARLKHVPKLNDSALKTLYLAENEITNIPAGIFLGLPNLEWLDLSKNKLDSAGLHPEVFKNLTKLKRLNLDGNQLTTVPALPSSLQELKMNDNHLERLQRHSFQGLFKLLTLELEGNQLHDGNVLPTAFKPLGRLIYLRLDRNHFRAIPSGLPASLQELHLDSNHIEEIPESILNKTLNLTVLVLSNNKLQEDRIAPRAWIDLPKLEALDLSHNRLALVPSFLPRHLKQLTLHHNCIERIPGYVFAHMKPGLEFLHLSHNVLQDDGIHAVSFLGLYHSLAELLLDNNQLQSIPRGILNLKGLQVLRLSHNRIRNIPLNSVCDTRVAEDSNIVSMHLENNLIDRRRIPPTAFSCIKAYHSVVLRPQQNEDEDDY